MNARRALTTAGPSRRSARPDAATGRGGARGRERADPARRTLIARNRRARFDYEVLDIFECGVSLKGSEVKSLREGRVSLADAFARVDRGELWLHGVHISPYDFAHGFGSHDPERTRKLLAHRREIDELAGRVQERSLTLVPLSLYFVDGKVKVEVALVKGRRTWDKRRVIAERDAKREAAREMSRVRRRGPPR